MRVVGFLLMAGGLVVLGQILGNTLDAEASPFEALKHLMDRDAGLQISLGAIGIGALFFCTGMIVARLEAKAK